MFKSVSIENFKTIRKLDIQNLGRVNLLVGENNCGKTTILEALTLLIGGNNPESLINLFKLRGLTTFYIELWRTFFHNLELDKEIKIKGITENKNGEYSLLIKPKRKEMTMGPLETAGLAALGAKGTSYIEARPSPVGLDLDYQNDKGEHLYSSVVYNEKNEELQYEGQKPGYFNGVFLGPTSMYSWLWGFDEVQRKKMVPYLVELLKNIDSQIGDLRLNAVGMLEVDIGLSHLLPINLMGGGLVKILSVITSIMKFENSFVFIDEIENGLHHKNQNMLWEAVFTWAERVNVQVFATTHSYECIKAFDEQTKGSLFQNQAKLYRIEKEEDRFKTIEFDSKDIDSFIENLWEMR